MTQLSNEVLREWVGILDLVADYVVAEESVPDDIADDLQQVIDRISAIAEPELGGNAGQQDARSRNDEDPDTEQLSENIRRRVREIQKRAIQ